MKEIDVDYDWSNYNTGMLKIYYERTSKNIKYYQELLDSSKRDLKAVQKELRRRKTKNCTSMKHDDLFLGQGIEKCPDCKEDISY